MGWSRRFILFHGKRHPAEMGPAEIAAFLSHLAVQEHVSASTQNQALSALLFLYRNVLGRPIERLDGIVHAKRPKRLPVVLTRDEIRAVLSKLHGTSWLVAWLLYGTGLRLSECLELRIKDLDLDRCQIVLRRGKGQKDRVTVLPSSVRPRLEEHLAHVRRVHDRDLARGLGAAPLPDAVARKYPNAARDWRWQFVFPAVRVCRNPRWGPACRFHVHESAIQRDVAAGVRAAGITKHATVHSLRHYAGSRTMPSDRQVRVGS